MQSLLEELQAALTKVKDYPVDSRELAELCQENKCNEDIVEFFRSLPDSIDFKDENDILARFQDSKLLEEQKKESPQEYVTDEP